MSTLKEFYESYKSDAEQLIKTELKGLIKEGKDDSLVLVRETAEKVERWTKMALLGDLSKEELEALLYARDKTIRQYANTVQIKARARVERLSVGLVNLMLDKVMMLI